MELTPLGLKIRAVVAAGFGAFVPIEPEPAQRRQDLIDHVLARSLEVRVLDPKDEHAVVMASVEPVEESGARAPEMEVTRRRGGKPNPRPGSGAGRSDRLGSRLGQFIG